MKMMAATTIKLGNRKAELLFCQVKAYAPQDRIGVLPCLLPIKNLSSKSPQLLTAPAWSQIQPS